MLRRIGFHGVSASLLLLSCAAPVWSQADDLGLIVQIAAEVEEEEDDEDVSQEVTVEINRDGKTLTITQTVDGEFVGEIVENEETTPIRAASLDELQEKFPDAHAAFQAKPAVPVAKPGQAAGITVQMSENQGDRKVEIQEPGRKVVMKDQRGEDIEITVKQDLEHGTRVERYEAEDVKSLQGKFPGIAQLYRKHLGQGNNAGGINVQIQGGQARFGFNPQGLGPRKIAGEHQGRKVLIKDENGRNIRITVTQTTDGKDESEEFAADDLPNLKKEHPEIARIYEKLAGKGLPPGQQKLEIFNGVPMRIPVQNQAVPGQVEPAIDPAAGQGVARQLQMVKRLLETSEKRLAKLAADEKNADAEAIKKLAEEISGIAKKIEELELKQK